MERKLDMETKISFIVIVEDNDFDLNALKNCASAISNSTPEPHEIFFITSKSQEGTVNWLLENGYTVVVNSSDYKRPFLFNQGLALSTGDPIIFLKSSFIVSESFLQTAINKLYLSDVGAVILSSEEELNSKFIEEELVKKSCFIISRSSFDLIGYFRGEEDINNEWIDFLARLKIAGYGYVIVPALSEEIASELDEIVKAKGEKYIKAEDPLYYERCYYRDHIKDEEVKLLSITSVACNRLDFLKQTFERFFEVTPELSSIPYEIIISENNSEDEKVRQWLLEQEFTTVVFNGENLGVASGKNQNLVLSMGDPIVQINPDMLLPESWFQKALELLSLPRVGVVCVPVEEGLQQSVSVDGIEVGIKPESIRGCWVIPRRTVEIVGHFCEEYETDGGENLDYAMRLMLSGLLNTYVPGIKCVHLEGEGATDSGKSSYEKKEPSSESRALYQKRVEAYKRGELPLRYERYFYRFSKSSSNEFF